jgi:hypothetical protein
MQNDIKKISIFLSSPGDVLQERQIVSKVINKLTSSPLLHDKINLELISWDQPGTTIPLLASISPQEAINQGMKLPADCDIVIVVLWSRLGTPLTTSSFLKPDGNQYLSGTEWEFLNAQEKAKQTSRPLILLFRRTEKVLLDPDASDFEEKTKQRKLVNEFFKSLSNPDGSIQYSYSSYTTPTEFESLLEQNITALVARLIDNQPIRPQPFLHDEVNRDSYPTNRFVFDITEPNAVDRKIFLLPASELIFGMSKREKHPDVDVVLRLLPSRSINLDPANWKASAMISKAHWRLRVIDGQVQLMDISKNGITISQTSLDDSSLESLGDIVSLSGTMPEEGEADFIRITKNEWLKIPDHLQLTLGNNLLDLKIETFRDERSNKVNSVRVSRLTNYPQHQYLQLIDRASIGNSPTCAVHFDIPGSNAVFGELLLKHGSIYINSFIDNGLNLNGSNLIPNLPTQLKEKDYLKFGNIKLLFNQALDNHFLSQTQHRYRKISLRKEK